jgi:hypothetical protein
MTRKNKWKNKGRKKNRKNPGCPGDPTNHNIVLFISNFIPLPILFIKWLKTIFFSLKINKLPVII